MERVRDEPNYERGMTCCRVNPTISISRSFPEILVWVDAYMGFVEGKERPKTRLSVRMTGLSKPLEVLSPPDSTVYKGNDDLMCLR